MLKILVPITFARGDSSGINMAFYIAKHQPCRITLLNCIPETIDREKEDRDYATKAAQLHERLAKYTELAREHNACIHNNLIIDSMLEYGYPEEIIVQTAHTKGYDLVVMTSESSENDMKQVTGSITNDVLRRIKVPLLVVPTHYKMQKDQITDILIGINFIKQEYTPLHQFISIVMEYRCKIHCIQFSNKRPTEEDMVAANNLNTYLTQTYRSAHFITEFIMGEDFYDTINDYIFKKNIQLITLIKKPKGNLFHWSRSSYTGKALYHIKIPVLIINH